MHDTHTAGTPMDRTDALYRVYLEIGDHARFGRGVIETFLSARRHDIPAMASTALVIEDRPHGHVVTVPVQLVPEIVRELGRHDVAVYQVVQLGRVGAPD